VRVDIAYGGCFLTFHAYRHRRDRRAVWAYPVGQHSCPLALYLMSLEPGPRTRCDGTRCSGGGKTSDSTCQRGVITSPCSWSWTGRACSRRAPGRPRVRDVTPTLFTAMTAEIPILETTRHHTPAARAKLNSLNADLRGCVAERSWAVLRRLLLMMRKKFASEPSAAEGQRTLR